MDLDPYAPLHHAAFAVALLLGGLVGSFLNVVAHRVPEGRSVVAPGSACPSCGRGIRPQHNLPVLGWLILRGRCADCGTRIAARYPLVEAGCAALFGAVFLAVLPSPSDAADGPHLVAFGVTACYFAALLAISLIDADHFIVPDSISLPLIPLGIVAAAGLDLLGAPSPGVPSVVLGAALGGGVMWAIAALGRRAFGKEAMGMGDVKLVAAIGAWQGAWPTLLLTIFLASMLGSIVGIASIALRGRDRAARIPFGPYLCVGALLSFVGSEAITARWLLF